jgi:hypothetical protein
MKWRQCKKFRVKASWSKHSDYKIIVRKVWQEKAMVADKWQNIRSKLKGCQHSLQKWVRKAEHQTEERIRQKTCDLAKLQMVSSNQTLNAEK